MLSLIANANVYANAAFATLANSELENNNRCSFCLKTKEANYS